MNPEDTLVTAISEWLAGHLGDAELLGRLESLPKEGLSSQQREAVDELVAELSQPQASRGRLQMVARETLETLALGS
jgi:hypothetical protein